VNNNSIKLNESFTAFKSLSDEQIKILTIFNEASRFDVKVQAGIKSPFELFYRIYNGAYIVPNGCLEVIGEYNKPIMPADLSEKLDKVIEKYQKFAPYDFQAQAIKDALFYKKLFIKSATGSGKSYVIGLIAKILTEMGFKGLILVPNITLTNQINSDFQDYELNIDTHLIGGDNNIHHLNKPLTISTWQSVQNFKELLPQLDFIIVDEAHTAKSDQIFDICNKCENAKYKIGLSGTLPEGNVNVMRLISIFGVPKTYITPRGLIDRGLATNAKINVVNIHYQFDFNMLPDYSSQLKKLKEYKPRNTFICKLSDEVSKSGNTMVLFSHTKHGLDLFYGITNLRDIKTDAKSYKDLVLQKANKIYFINGLIEGKAREIIRNILETENNAILVANYACVGTGTNIKNLHNMILASPLKSYVTITQSIGRGLRLNDNKSIFRLYDIADHIGYFRRQIAHRIKNSYAPEGYEISQTNINL